MWGGMIWPSLETTLKTITVAGNFVFITLGTLNCPDFHFEDAGHGPVRSVETMSCIAAHLRSRSLNIVSFLDMIEGSYRSCNLYTTGQLVDGLHQKKKKRKPVFIKLKWNHVVFSRATILSFHPVPRRGKWCFPSSLFVGTRVQNEAPEKGRKTYRPKRCEYNNENGNNNLRILSDKNYQTSSQKFTHIILICCTVNATWEQIKRKCGINSLK